MELSQAHEIIYSHLLDLHRQDPNFRFFLHPYKANAWGKPFIKEDNIAISFWTSQLGEYYSMLTPISLCFKIKSSQVSIYLAIQADDSPNKIKYFKQMASELEYKAQKTDFIYIWEKKLPFISNDFKNFITNFLKTEKPVIDDYLNKDGSYWTYKSTVSDDNFEKCIAINESFFNFYLDNKIKQNKTCILKYLKVRDYQGIKSVIIKNLPNDAQWIFLTGENGFGKTSLLRAIAKGLLGDEEKVTQINEKTKIVVGIINDSGFILSKLVEKGKRHTSDIDVLGYGISRFSIPGDKNDGNAYTLFEDDGQLLSIETLLKTADEPTFEKIKFIFKRIIPNLEDIKKINNNGFYEIRYQEKNEKGDTFDSVKLNDLAAGYRGIITMIGDMMRRFNNYMEKSFEEVSGIVIIDEFDAHLHPKYQYELPKLLSTVFPKIQFIVSTHSPIPLLGVEPNTAVVLTVNRTKELGITVDRLDDDIDIDRLSANALLTSDIFGFKTIFARGATPDTIEPFDDYKDIKEMNELEKRMELKQGFKDLNIKIG